MFRRTLTAALFVMGAPVLLSCQATESVSANAGSTFRDRGLSINSIQTAARTPSAGFSTSRTSANLVSARTVVRTGSDVEVAGLTLSPVQAQSLPGWMTERHGDALEAFLESCVVLGQRDANEQASPSPLGGARRARAARRPAQPARDRGRHLRLCATQRARAARHPARQARVAVFARRSAAR